MPTLRRTLRSSSTACRESLSLSLSFTHHTPSNCHCSAYVRIFHQTKKKHLTCHGQSPRRWKHRQFPMLSHSHTHINHTHVRGYIVDSRGEEKRYLHLFLVQPSYARTYTNLRGGETEREKKGGEKKEGKKDTDTHAASVCTCMYLCVCLMPSFMPRSRASRCGEGAHQSTARGRGRP